MARVGDAELDRLKAEVSVQRMAEARGIELRRHGADLHGLCPFHEDRSGRAGTIFEHDFGRQIGVDIAGNAASRLRVVVNPAGDVWTAFPF